MQTEQQEVIDLALEIERYLASHPHAADSLDGVVRWWLTRSREEPAHKVRRALDYLVSCGVVITKTLAGGKVLYIRARQSRHQH